MYIYVEEKICRDLSPTSLLEDYRYLTYFDGISFETVLAWRLASDSAVHLGLNSLVFERLKF